MWVSIYFAFFTDPKMSTWSLSNVYCTGILDKEFLHASKARLVNNRRIQRHQETLMNSGNKRQKISLVYTKEEYREMEKFNESGGNCRLVRHVTWCGKWVALVGHRLIH